jgi:hypothetical protein
MPGMSDGGRFLAVALITTLAIAGCVPPPAGRASSTPAPGRASSTDASGIQPLPPTPEPTRPADPAAAPSFVRPTPNPSPSFLVYVAQAGDTLTSIARHFGTTARSIAYWNRAQYPSLDPDSATYEPDRIKVGWTFLLIPAEVVDEDELPDPAPAPASPSPSPS